MTDRYTKNETKITEEKQKIQYTYNKSKGANYLFDLAKTVVYVMVLISLAFSFCIRDAKVVGDSMLDTLHPNDRVILTNFMYEPKIGDIVVLNAEDIVEKRIIKRVIATGGQTLQIDFNTNSVYVDGIKLNEPYISSLTRQSNNPASIPYVIPEDCIFVMGDNRIVSKDSRNAEIGLVSVDEIIGKAQFIFYPFDRAGYLY